MKSRTLEAAKKVFSRALIAVMVVQNFAFAVPFARAANTCTFSGAGDGTSFTDSANWNACGGVSPQPADDVVIPNSIQLLSTSGTGTDPSDVFVSGSYAYVVNSASQDLTIFNVSDPTAPTTESTTSLGTVEPQAIFVSGSYAYIVGGSTTSPTNGGFAIVDVSNPAAPSVSSTTTAAGSLGSVYVSGSYAYMLDVQNNLLKNYDVSNPAAPSAGSSKFAGLFPLTVVVSGSYAYVTNFNDNLKIYDLTTPSNPSLVSTTATGGTRPWGITVDGSYAYIANSSSGTVTVLDVSTPSSPSVVGGPLTLAGANFPYSVVKIGNYLYISNNSNSTMSVVDVTDPTIPLDIGVTSVGSGPARIFASGDNVYIPNAGASTLEIYKVVPPFFIVEQDNTSTTINSLTIQGTTAVMKLLGHNLTVTTFVDNEGVLNIGGGTFTVGDLYNAGTINGSGEISSVTNVSGYLDNENVFYAGLGTYHVAGDWFNYGTFSADGSLVDLNGSAQTMYGSATFNDLKKQTVSTDTLTFEDGQTQTVVGTLTMNGASGNLLSIRSFTPGNQWIFDPQGTRALDYLDVKDSNNSNATAIAFNANFVNSGNNTNWTFGAPTLNTTNNTVVLSREAINATATATISFTLADTLSSQLTMTFDPAFTGMDVSGASASTPTTPGCMTNFVATGANTFTADKSGCTGPVVISGVIVVNPPTAGPYLVSWVNDDPGYALVAIVDSDQVTVNATVSPTITFDLDTNTTGADTPAPYSVALGALTTGAVNHSDNGTVNSIYAQLDTNATSGALVTVLSSNAALKSASAPGDTIPNSAASMAAGAANYGICVNSVTPPAAATGIFQPSSPYNAGTCDPAGDTNAVKALSIITPTPILDSAGAPLTSGTSEILVNAAISTSTAAHSDYTDTLTFVATGTF